jgi:hypothetical protein
VSHASCGAEYGFDRRSDEINSGILLFTSLIVLLETSSVRSSVRSSTMLISSHSSDTGIVFV